MLFPWVVEAFQVLLCIEDDKLVQEFIAILLWYCTFLIEELGKLKKERFYIVGNLSKRIERLNHMSNNLPYFIGFLRIFLSISLRPPGLPITIVRLLLVEVLMPDKYFVVFHVYNG